MIPYLIRLGWEKVLGYFLGSKQNLLLYIIIEVFYHFYVQIEKVITLLQIPNFSGMSLPDVISHISHHEQNHVVIYIMKSTYIVDKSCIYYEVANA